MSGILLLPCDLFMKIVGYICLSKDMISMKETATSFNDIINMKKIKYAYMNELFESDNKQPNYCVNEVCGWFNTTIAGLYKLRPKNKCMGKTTFYWPEELCEQHDYEGDPYGVNREYRIRENQCNSGKSVVRLIPYCQMCMCMYVNMGERNDVNEVPYEGNDGTNNF